jgi:hypothetical protein
LLAVDIDGTLLNPTYQISAADLAALRRAHAAGIEIVLGTGRRHTFALPVAQELGFDLWLISSNGAVTRSARGQTFHRELLPIDAARRLCAHMLPFRGNTVLTFDHEEKGALVVERVDELAISIQRWMEKNERYIAQVAPLEAALVTDPLQVMFGGTVARMEAAQGHLRAGGFVEELTVVRTQYDHRDLCIVDVLHRAVSKGRALERWARHRGFRREEVMAIGDNHNDVEMLEFAGIPFIMGNAAPELKQDGWRITLTNDQSGVAAALAEVGI